MPNWTKEQLSAIETSGTNIIVSAGAGSGKTAVLTNRVINKLKNGVHINELLILTFTRAAANEMKERIRKAIKKEPTLINELSKLDSSYITTFDSYSLSIVKKYHYYLNISNNISITDSTIISMKKKEIINNIFNNYYGMNNTTFNKLIEDFCVKDDKEIIDAILKISEKIELLPNKYNYLNEYINNYFNQEFIDKIITNYNKLLLNKIEDLKELLFNFKFLVDNDYYMLFSSSLTNLINSKTIEDIYLNSIIKLPNLSKGIDDEVKQEKEKIKKKIDEIVNYKNYGNESNIRNNINNSKELISLLINIIKEYFITLDNYKNTNEIYDFQDIALLSIKLIKENKDVLEEIKSSFKEIMIDEYQDTNDIQETFISLISNNNVYMVGDIKQSIYRFRNANPNIFKNKYEQYKNNNNGIKIDLLKNFRSRKEVLDNINYLFNFIMDNNIGGADYIDSHQMIFGNNSYIEEGNTNQDYQMKILEYPEHSEYRKEEIEIFTIAKDIKEKINNKYQIFDKDKKELHNATYNDFVILIDRGTTFDLYKKIFEYMGIPLTILKEEKLNDSMDIYIIKNIINIVIKIKNNNLDQQFKYDFMSIARSYLYQMNDQELLEIFANNTFKDTILYQNMQSLADNINNQPINIILDNIINITNMYEKVITIGDIKSTMIRLQKLQEISSSLSAAGYDIYMFDDYLKTLIEEKYEMKYSNDSTNNNSVKIMTIHKSKGLEYNICYFSGLYKEFNIKDIQERFTYDSTYGLITPYFDEGIKENITKELLKDKYLEEEISEKIRLFYVALTRAKEQMILVIPQKEESKSFKEEGILSLQSRKKYKSFLDILLSLKNELKSYINTIDLNSINLTKEYLKNKDINNNIDNNSIKLHVKEIDIQNELIKSSSYSKKMDKLIDNKIKDNLLLGLKIHETLELIDFKNYDENIIEDNFIRNKVTSFLNNNLLKDINNANIYKEYEFIYNNGDEEQHGIIDLMLEYQDHIDIIDYKLNNTNDEKYNLQLNGYKNYINSITTKNVNIYLYSIINEEIKKIS